MIPLKFYRDDEYVYYNNPNGITKKITIADFEAVMSGSGGGGGGETGGGVLVVSYDAETDGINKSYKEIKEAVASGKIVVLNRVITDNGTVFLENMYYLVGIAHENTDSYVVTFGSSYYFNDPVLSLYIFEATTDTGTPIKIYPMPH